MTWAEEMRSLDDGEACPHPGCLAHVTHPCECCGRIAGRKAEEPPGWQPWLCEILPPTDRVFSGSLLEKITDPRIPAGHVLIFSRTPTSGELDAVCAYIKAHPGEPIPRALCASLQVFEPRPEPTFAREYQGHHYTVPEKCRNCTTRDPHGKACRRCDK